MTKYDIAASIATTLGTQVWKGRLTAKQQRQLFGRYLFGRRHLVIDPTGQGIVSAYRKVCFGLDFDVEEMTFEQIAKA